MFLKIEGVEGEAQDAKHKAEMQIESFSFGGSQSGSFATGGGGGSGKVNMQDFHFVIDLGKHTPKAFELLCTGKHIPCATLSVRKAGGDQLDYLKIKFSDLIISSYQIGGGKHGDLPMDQVSFGFTKIEMEYKEQKKDGSLGGAVTCGYDVKMNKKV
jgi:type VI secretion system secreted protein Hcp